MIENLSKEQLERILDTLPVDLSFIDQNDQVRFWNRHEARAFKRPETAMGSTVQNCHPRQSLAKVNEIIQDFKDGNRQIAEFWINHQGMKLYIVYYPVRDKSGKYLGTLEVTQEITRIKGLLGEKRLLD